MTLNWLLESRIAMASSVQLNALRKPSGLCLFRELAPPWAHRASVLGARLSAVARALQWQRALCSAARWSSAGTEGGMPFSCRSAARSGALRKLGAAAGAVLPKRARRSRPLQPNAGLLPSKSPSGGLVDAARTLARPAMMDGWLGGDDGEEDDGAAGDDDDD
eukprot:scaffold2592_cov395-Prasinococcus_capsulatus_cf.AAC.1